MRRPLLLLAAALAGLFAGGASMMAIQSPGEAPGEPRPESLGGGESEVRTWSGAGTEPPIQTLISSEDRLLLVWTAGGLPDRLGESIATLPGVQQVTTVAGDVVDLVSSHASNGAVVDDLDEGWAIPLDAIAFDPAEYAAFLPKADHASVATLPDGHVLLGASSAELRGLQPGDTMTFAGGHEARVHAVVDDTLVGAAEIVLPRGDADAVGIDTDRFLLLSHSGERASIEQAIRRLTDVEVRVRGPGETPYLRHGDAVLPQVHVKTRFGEFAYRRTDAEIAIHQDPAWVKEHLADLDLPILGQVRCHRSIGKQLHGALSDLVDRDLDHLVDHEQFAGCHAARLIAPDAGVSRHAWGIAVDLNVDDNRYGDTSVQDPRLVETLARWGFTWGGFWLIPDAMHFEYVGEPEVDAAKVHVPAVTGTTD